MKANGIVAGIALIIVLFQILPEGSLILTPPGGVEAAQAYKRHVDKVNGFSLTVPSDWKEKDSTGRPGIALALICPGDEKTKGIPTSLSVIVKDTTMSLDECAAYYLKDYRQNQTFKLVEQRKVSIGTVPAVRMYATLKAITYPPPKYESYMFTLSILSYVLTNGKRAFNILFMTEEPKFPAYGAAFDGIAQTFRFE
jgi:hypothetical protein